jgi:hypothetical protein
LAVAMNFIIFDIISGVTATAGMIFLLWLLDWGRKVNPNLNPAVGCTLSRAYEISLQPGILINFGHVTIFAIVYNFIFRMMLIT